MYTRISSRRTGLLAILTATGAVALGVFAITGAQAKAPRKLTIVSVQQVFRQIPGGGAIIDLDKTTAGKTIGADTLICLKAAPSCATTVDLGGNDLFLLTKLTKTGAAGTIVGGTGRYAHAAGTVIAKNVTATKDTVTFSFK